MNEKRLDLKLTESGDLTFDEFGDIVLTDGIRQAILIRLRWFLDEWLFAPRFGMPYFEEILVKNPDIERVKTIIRDECLTVEGVTDIKDIVVNFDTRRRHVSFVFSIVTTEATYNEEVNVRV